MHNGGHSKHTHPFGKGLPKELLAGIKNGGKPTTAQRLTWSRVQLKKSRQAKIPAE